MSRKGGMSRPFSYGLIMDEIGTFFGVLWILLLVNIMMCLKEGTFRLTGSRVPTMASLFFVLFFGIVLPWFETVMLRACLLDKRDIRCWEDQSMFHLFGGEQH